MGEPRCCLLDRGCNTRLPGMTQSSFVTAMSIWGEHNFVQKHINSSQNGDRYVLVSPKSGKNPTLHNVCQTAGWWPQDTTEFRTEIDGRSVDINEDAYVKPHYKEINTALRNVSKWCPSNVTYLGEFRHLAKAWQDLRCFGSDGKFHVSAWDLHSGKRKDYPSVEKYIAAVKENLATLSTAHEKFNPFTGESGMPKGCHPRYFLEALAPAMMKYSDISEALQVLATKATDWMMKDIIMAAWHIQQAVDHTLSLSDLIQQLNRATAEIDQYCWDDSVCATRQGQRNRMKLIKDLFRRVKKTKRNIRRGCAQRNATLDEVTGQCKPCAKGYRTFSGDECYQIPTSTTDTGGSEKKPAQAPKENKETPKETKESPKVSRCKAEAKSGCLEPF